MLFWRVMLFNNQGATNYQCLVDSYANTTILLAARAAQKVVMYVR